MNDQDMTREELQKELKDLQKEFYYLNAIKDIDDSKRIQLEQELAIALQEIAFQNEEKEKRAAELIIANLELKFQSEEKEKRAAELIIANIELVFQNKEKEKRAAELVIANKELAFQNKEKEKRAEELTLAKEIAQEFENKFRQIAENIDEVFWLRTNSEMIYVSPSFEKIWGVPCDTLYKNPQVFTDIIHPEDKLIVEEIVKSNEFKVKGLFQYEYRIIRADNQVRWINAKTVPILDESGNIIKRVGIASDITEKYYSIQELIKAKEHAEESDRLKTAFLCNMSHEIRTPMNGILGFADLLKEPKLTGEEQQKYIAIIEKSGARMLNIINDIISISKIESGLIELSFSKTNIKEQLEEEYTFFKPEAEQKGIKLILKINLPIKEATISTDKEKLYVILTNLIKNAIKFTDKGRIEIGCDSKNNDLLFYVKDTGVGIHDDRQEAIFERFIQADIDDKRAFQGAGLGLSISKAYVEMLGGKIWVESEVDKGSTFYFTIPLVNEREKELIIKNETAFAGIVPKNNLKILLVEDDECSEMILSILIKDYSRELLIARNGKEAVAVCENNTDIDLILMDMKMPVMSGFEATREIRLFNKEVIIIAQTAYTLIGDKEKALDAGCNDYISKPITKYDLQILMQKHFSK